MVALLDECRNAPMKTKSYFAIRPAIRLATLLLCCSTAGASTIIQTKNFSFTPTNNQTLTFDKFDDMGGTRILNSVTITTSLTKSGGSLYVDNDSGVAASGSISQSVTINLSATGVSLINAAFDSIIGSNVTSTSFYEANLAADDGDGPGYQPGGLDWGGTEFGSVTAAQTESAGSIDGYKGTGSTYTIKVSGTQSTDTATMSGVAGAFSPATASGFVTVTYNYIPEPATSMLLCVALGGILCYRRKSC